MKTAIKTGKQKGSMPVAVFLSSQLIGKEAKKEKQKQKFSARSISSLPVKAVRVAWKRQKGFSKKPFVVGQNGRPAMKKNADAL